MNRAAIELENGDTKKAMEDANRAISLDQWLKEGYAVRALINDKLNDAKAAANDRAKADKLVSHFDI